MKTVNTKHEAAAVCMGAIRNGILRESVMRWSRLAALSAVTIAPAWSMMSVVAAAPPERAPSWGYERGRDVRDYSFQDAVTIIGTVVRDTPGNQFELRGDNGRTYQVVLHGAEPGRLSAGDRVEVRGRVDRDIMTGDSLRILRDRDPYVTLQVVTVEGTVTRDLPGDEFEMRTREGRTFRVISHDPLPVRMATGERITVRGYIDRNLLITRGVQMLRDSDTLTTLQGTVTRDLTGNNQFEMRGDDGRIYQVVLHQNEPTRLSAGDRVEVRGRLDREIMIGHSLRILRDRDIRDTRPGYNNRTMLRGVVTRDLRGDQFQIRTEDGRDFLITTRNTEPRGLSLGDRVEVMGAVDPNQRDRFDATDVVILRDRDNRDPRDPRTNPETVLGPVDFEATVTSDVQDGRFNVRGDNGRDYMITTREKLPAGISNGDRVRVVGTALNATVVRAETVRVIRNNRATDNNNNGRDDRPDRGAIVDFTGTVLTVNNLAGVIQVRGDNGQTYSVLSRAKVSRNDRVRVRGTWERDAIKATDVVRQ